VEVEIVNRCAGGEHFRKLTAMTPSIVRKLAGFGYALLALILVVAFYRDYGVTWDDPFHAKVGALALRYFESGGVDRGIHGYDDARFYGPMHDLVPALLRGSAAALDAAHFELRHLWNGLFAIALIPAILHLGRGFRASGAAPLALLALVAQPRFLGDVLQNSKDVPFAVAMAWFHLALLCLVRTRRPIAVEWIAFGAGFGFALLQRPGAFPMLLVESLVVFAARDLLSRDRLSREAVSRPDPGSRGFLLGFLGALALAWCIMVLPWPSAHREPLVHPLRTMGAAVRFYTEYPVLWEGEYRSSADLPRTYLPTMLRVTTPIVVGFFAIVGTIFAGSRLLRRPRSRTGSHALVVLAWIVVPLCAAIVTRPNVYDGIRHFLFILPAIALLAGYGAARIAATLPRRFGRLRGGVVSLVLLVPLLDSVRLHPYAYTYFNEFVGGVAGASGRYETDYFVTAYREAMGAVAAKANADPSRRFVVMVGGAESMLDGVKAFAPANLEVRLARPDRNWPARLPADVDLYVGACRFRLATEPFAEEPIVFRVEREGAVFAVIRARDGIW